MTNSPPDAAPTVDNGTTAPATVDAGGAVPAVRAIPPTVDAGRAETNVAGPPARINLPRQWADEFTDVRLVGRGTQADVLLVKRIADGAELVVKAYRVTGERFSQIRALLPKLDHPSLVHVERFELLEGDWWELQEYLPGGTLLDLRAGHISAASLTALTKRMSQAIIHLHQIGLIHRDLKPSNIMFRTLRPFQPVLGDLGLAMFMDASQDYGSGSGTPPYAPPENAYQKVTEKFDWWSLGMVILEYASGQHPLRRPDGQWMRTGEMLETITKTVIPIPDSLPARLRSLCAGLLTIDVAQRWGATQVRTWLNGGSPPVQRNLPTTSSTASGTPQGAAATQQAAASASSAAEPIAHVITVGGKEYRSLDQLAAALAAEPRAGRRIIAGRAGKAPDFIRLQTYFAELGRGDLEARLERVKADDAGLAELLARMSEKLPPTFATRDISPAGLHALIAEAATSSDAVELIGKLHAAQALTAFSSDKRPGGAKLAVVDDAWRGHLEIFRRRRHSPADAPIDTATVALLRATIDPQYAATLHGDADAAARDAVAVSTGWFRELAARIADKPNPGVDLAIVLAHPSAQSEEIERREKQRLADAERLAEVEREARERLRSEEIRRRMAITDQVRMAVGGVFGGLITVVITLGGIFMGAVGSKIWGYSMSEITEVHYMVVDAQETGWLIAVLLGILIIVIGRWAPWLGYPAAVIGILIGIWPEYVPDFLMIQMPDAVRGLAVDAVRLSGEWIAWAVIIYGIVNFILASTVKGIAKRP